MQDPKRQTKFKRKNSQNGKNTKITRGMQIVAIRLVTRSPPVHRAAGFLRWHTHTTDKHRKLETESAQWVQVLAPRIFHRVNIIKVIQGRPKL